MCDGLGIAGALPALAGWPERWHTMGPGPEKEEQLERVRDWLAVSTTTSSRLHLSLRSLRQRPGIVGGEKRGETRGREPATVTPQCVPREGRLAGPSAGS